MKFIVPKYYKEFKCIADKCKHNCCTEGWEIDIDSNTAELYKKMPGEWGEKIRQNVEFGETTHFKLNEKHTCPFLNDKHLCDVYLNLGDKYMCQICNDHPRYFEWFEDIKEGGVGLCCEEAGRLILSNNEKFSTIEEEINEDGLGNYDKNLFNFFKEKRAKLINYLDDTLSINTALKNIIIYAKKLQEIIDEETLDQDEFSYFITENNEKEIHNLDEFFSDNYLGNTTKINIENFKNILDFFINLEANNKNWTNYLEKNTEKIQYYFAEKNEFLNNYPEIKKYLKNISIYFIWRYFIKATFDGDVFSRINLMVSSILIIEFLFYCEYRDLGAFNLNTAIEVVRKYSEEVEYSDDNVQALADSSYELDIFSAENLCNLL